MIVSIHVISFVLVLKRLVNIRKKAMCYSLLYNYLITVNQIVGNLSMMVRADTDIDKDYTEFTDYHAHLILQGHSSRCKKSRIAPYVLRITHHVLPYLLHRNIASS